MMCVQQIITYVEKGMGYPMPNQYCPTARKLKLSWIGVDKKLPSSMIPYTYNVIDQ